MKPKLFTREEAVEFIKKQQGKRTIYQYAADLGVSHVLLYQLYRGAGLPGPKLGFRKIVKQNFMFERVEKA